MKTVFSTQRFSFDSPKCRCYVLDTLNSFCKFLWNIFDSGSVDCLYLYTQAAFKRAAFCVRHFATNVMYTICFGSLVFVYVFVVVYTKIELDTSHTQHTRARARWIFSKFSLFPRWPSHSCKSNNTVGMERVQCHCTHPSGAQLCRGKGNNPNWTRSLGPLLFQEIVYFRVIFYTCMILCGPEFDKVFDVITASNPSFVMWWHQSLLLQSKQNLVIGNLLQTDCRENCPMCISTSAL